MALVRVRKPDGTILEVDISGEDGYTPKKGVDYFTEKEKTEFVNAVITALPNGDEVEY